jgi:4-oxalocrotonate tautomerase
MADDGCDLLCSGGTIATHRVRRTIMPVINVDGPPLTTEKKRELVKRLTDAAVDIYKIENIVVFIRENPPENVGVNGVLVADR